MTNKYFFLHKCINAINEIEIQEYSLNFNFSFRKTFKNYLENVAILCKLLLFETKTGYELLCKLQ